MHEIFICWCFGLLLFHYNQRCCPINSCYKYKISIPTPYFKRICQTQFFMANNILICIQECTCSSGFSVLVCTFICFCILCHLFSQISSDRVLLLHEKHKPTIAYSCCIQDFLRIRSFRLSLATN